MRRVEAVAADRESGASDILKVVLGILGDALGRPAELPAVARALCRAQPTMAPVWNAVLEALASRDAPERFERFVRRIGRAPRALARFAQTCFATDRRPDALRIVTISSSRSVATVIDALRTHQPLRVACSESRPALEGRRLAAALAASGVPVSYFGDAAIGAALVDADAVLLGADAVTPGVFLNKSGTRMLTAAAGLAGVPVYVAATRDKFVTVALAARLDLREGDPAEVWDRPPDGVGVRNPYFEATPLDGVTTVISDIGVLGAGMVPEVCRAAHDEAMQRALDEIG
jgi:translation initiation factor 2B subunit (eIF-2B alpha/beta/delta family)